MASISNCVSHCVALFRFVSQGFRKLEQLLVTKEAGLLPRFAKSCHDLAST
jgi:hypothetical protein